MRSIAYRRSRHYFDNWSGRSYRRVRDRLVCVITYMLLIATLHGRSVFNTLLPFNTSMYQIYAHRCYKFNAENAVNTPGGSIHSTGNVTYKRFKISVPVPRIWAFADANVSLGVPQNVGVGVFAYCVNSDSISLGVDQCRARITLAATIKWKDY